MSTTTRALTTTTIIDFTQGHAVLRTTNRFVSIDMEYGYLFLYKVKLSRFRVS